MERRAVQETSGFLATDERLNTTGGWIWTGRRHKRSLLGANGRRPLFHQLFAHIQHRNNGSADCCFTGFPQAPAVGHFGDVQAIRISAWSRYSRKCTQVVIVFGALARSTRTAASVWRSNTHAASVRHTTAMLNTVVNRLAKSASSNGQGRCQSRDK